MHTFSGRRFVGIGYTQQLVDASVVFITHRCALSRPVPVGRASRPVPAHSPIPHPHLSIHPTHPSHPPTHSMTQSDAAHGAANGLAKAVDDFFALRGDSVAGGCTLFNAHVLIASPSVSAPREPYCGWPPNNPPTSPPFLPHATGDCHGGHLQHVASLSHPSPWASPSPTLQVIAMVVVFNTLLNYLLEEHTDDAWMRKVMLPSPASPVPSWPPVISPTHTLTHAHTPSPYLGPLPSRRRGKA